MTISTILEKIDENQLFVPAFQREYVWKRDDAKQLIDSLIKEYPTGTMLTCEAGSSAAFIGRAAASDNALHAHHRRNPTILHPARNHERYARASCEFGDV